MNFGELAAALVFRDVFRGRQERQRVREEAIIQWESAFRSIEDIVIDEYGLAAGDVMARLDAIDVWLAGLDPNALVDEAASTARFASAREPIRVWAGVPSLVSCVR